MKICGAYMLAEWMQNTHLGWCLQDSGTNNELMMDFHNFIWCFSGARGTDKEFIMNFQNVQICIISTLILISWKLENCKKNQQDMYLPKDTKRLVSKDRKQYICKHIYPGAIYKEHQEAFCKN